MTYTIDPVAYKWDVARLPPDLHAAWIGTSVHGNLFHLTETHFAFRQMSGSGVWIIGTLEELLPHFTAMPVSRPYSPPVRSTDYFDPLDFSAIDFKL